MGRLVSAEFRKILTTKMWWALLIPTVAVALAWSWLGSLLTSTVIDQIANSAVMRQGQVNIGQLSWSVLFFARTINISAIFPMVFGALALSSEITRRTITTSYLTAPTRGSLLISKLVTYAAWGVAYGVVICGVTSLGLVLGSNPAQLPDAQGWTLMFLAGVVSSLLWTLLGLGVGALFGSVVGTVITLLVYTLLAENLVGLMLPYHWPGVLINGSADGLTGSVAARLLVDQTASLYQSRLGQLIPEDGKQAFSDLIRVAAGAKGAFDWWASGLIFAGWAAVFVVIGWLVSKARDIT
jgi:ABC-2 type transport system permease protein